MEVSASFFVYIGIIKSQEEILARATAFNENLKAPGKLTKNMERASLKKYKLAQYRRNILFWALEKTEEQVKGRSHKIGQKIRKHEQRHCHRKVYSNEGGTGVGADLLIELFAN